MIRYSKISLLAVLILSLLVSCTKSEEDFNPQSLRDLKGHTLAVLDGSYQYAYVKNYDEEYGFSVSVYQSLPDCYMAVASGMADAVMLSDLNACNINPSLGLKICAVLEEVFTEFGFIVQKGNTELLEELNSFITEIKASGELDEIYRRWVDKVTGDYHDCVRVDPIPANSNPTGNVLVVGNAGVEPPASVLLDNQWTGFEIEMVTRFAEHNGYQIQMQTYSFHNLIPSLQYGKIDIGASTFIISEERKQKVDFTQPTGSAHSVLVIKDKESNKEASFFQSIKKSINTSLIAESRWKLILQGLWVTVVVTFAALVFGTILGSGICWMRMNRRRSFQRFAKFYQYVLRNTPILVFLMIMYYVIFANSSLSPISVAILAFSLNSSAFMSEIFRTGIMSVDNGQREAGRGIGCTKFQTFRYIILPQAIKSIVPVYKNESVTLLKGTAIVGYISIIDLTKGSDLIRSATFEAFFPLIVITVVYFILATIMTKGIDRLLLPNKRH